MKTIPAQSLSMEFAATKDPVATVALGERFAVDAASLLTGGFLTRGEPEKAGIPLTGPIAIRGVAPGDVLRVEIHDIAIAAQGAMATLSGRGCFPGGLAASTRILDIRDGLVLFDDDIRLPVVPMIGKLGLATPGRALGGSDVGDHGGNLDCKDLTAGSSILLPVAVAEGLLYAGDLHALQGDGECSLTGVEVEGTVTLSCHRMDGMSLERPVILRDGRAIFLAAGETLDEAVGIVLEDAAARLQQAKGWSREKAAMLLSAAADLGICQVVNPHVTVKLSVDARHLGAPFATQTDSDNQGE